MRVDQDWPSVWPTAHSFKASVVPLPLRMGFIRTKLRNRNFPPKAHANLELMKIPNFLHLTPLAIQRHCEAISKFCTKWPVGVETDQSRQAHFPIEVTFTDYIFAGPSVRDPRARVVTLKVKLSSLNLDKHGRLKMIKLVGTERYDSSTDTITIITDRCPARVQNRDYAIYLLTALYFQSWKVEDWEKDIAEEDRLEYIWDETRSKKAFAQFLLSMKHAYSNIDPKDQKRLMCYPKYLESFLDSAEVGKVAERMEKVEEVVAFKDTIEKYRNEEETEKHIENYAKCVRRLLALPNLE